MIAFLLSTYRSRLFRLYAFNTPMTLFLTYKVIKTFMDESTSEKVILTKNKTDEKLFLHCNPN